MAVLKSGEIGRLLTGVEADACFNWLKSTPQTVVIAGGILTVSGDGWYIVDTEGGAATDDLERINGTSEGNPIRLRSADASRVITVKHGAFLKMAIGSDGLGTDFMLENPYHLIQFVSYGSDVLVETGRHANGL